ncbi:PQQ-like beta-propeller repeat protein [Streptosporangium sp. NBC_01639]|uniref:outer membrane protein assembly factor BamB family protein n=1 Tax=Streptosporangium sp. NBC_01639 TaxID=2975948 RepID=UPI00386DC781|nr:PQQ-like beta-propeller repeat protein [Streptosporangium sp. NBC_01639]
MPVIRTHAKPVLVLAGALALAGCSGTEAATPTSPTWHNPGVNAVSRIAAADGVAMTTSAKPDGTLETVALDLASGRKLWAHPATMAGRLPGMGIPAPAIIETGGGQSVAVALDPARKGRWNATLIARDARTGAQKWTRPVHSTFGPQKCGAFVCLSEQTALATARVVVLDPTTGRPMWKLPGIAEVEWSDASRVVFLRLAKHPVLESYDLKTGKPGWRLPIEQALGVGVDMSGGWSFGATADNLTGYVAPYTNPKTEKTSAFGLFSVRLADGRVNWLRPSVVRVYPSGSPGFAPVVRPVDQQGQYGGFARLDAESGRVLGQIPATQVPDSGWWLAFPARMEKVGFLKHDKPGSAFDLATGRSTEIKKERGWSFCVTDPKPLALKGQNPGFYPVASLCEYDLAGGRKLTGSTAPPAWFTGSQDGWRTWRDEQGGLHGIKDGTGTSPGMYG